MTISIIITVYNKEKYIDKCIKSVINQTYKDLEIIIINDGSNDESEKYIKKYIYDKRIIYIKQCNSGVAIARNNGIQKATSEYIYFLDGDDELDYNAISELTNDIKDCPDIVIGNFIFKDDKYLIKNTPLKEGCFYTERQLNNTQFKFDMFTSNGRPLASACNKLYRKKFIETNKLLFDSEIVSEDRLFNLYAFCYEPKISIINKYSYIVNLSKSSRSRSFNPNFYYDSINLFEKFRNFTVERLIFDKYQDLLFLTLLNDIEKIHNYIFNYSQKRYKDMLHYTKLINNNQDYIELINIGIKKRFLNSVNSNSKRKFLVMYAFVLVYMPNLTFIYYTIYRGLLKAKEVIKREIIK